MRTLIWLDDVRNPNEDVWSNYIRKNIGTNFEIIWVKNYNDFTSYINENGLPDFISFDHDLGDTSENEKTGYDCAKAVVDYCINRNIDIPMFYIHSNNPAGAANIMHYMLNYHDFWIFNKK